MSALEDSIITDRKPLVSTTLAILVEVTASVLAVIVIVVWPVTSTSLIAIMEAIVSVTTVV